MGVRKERTRWRRDRVRTGLEVLCDRHGAELEGRRAALLAHAASVTADLEYAWDRLRRVHGLTLAALFSPEHGLMGTHQDQEGVERDHDFGPPGTPLFSLYGSGPESLRPRPEMLEGIDLFLVDLQDVGSRYYTYVYTLAHCMEACREAGIEVWVLDRPNPIGGLAIEGNLVEPGCRSFVGGFPLPVRHGMTIGEVALMINGDFGISCHLRVIPMEGWRREMWFDETGLPWVPPSPNMPTLETATVYPGSCLLEGTNLSEGRGTTRPFEILGAPWIDPVRYARALDAADLPGVRFRPLLYRPTFHKYAGRTCGGIQIHVLDRESFLPFLTGIHLLRCAAAHHPEAFAWRREPYEFETRRPAIDLLAGGTWLREGVEQGFNPAPLPDRWEEETRGFRARRREILLYD